VVTIAVAWAYGDKIALRYAEDDYKTQLRNNDPLRQKLLTVPFDPVIVNLSPNSVLHSSNTLARPDSIVFTSTQRYPRVSNVIAVPLEITAMCSDHIVLGDNRSDLRSSFKMFLNDGGNKDALLPILRALRPQYYGLRSLGSCITWLYYYYYYYYYCYYYLQVFGQLSQSVSLILSMCGSTPLKASIHWRIHTKSPERILHYFVLLMQNPFLLHFVDLSCSSSG